MYLYMYSVCPSRQHTIHVSFPWIFPRSILSSLCAVGGGGGGGEWGLEGERIGEGEDPSGIH